MVSSISEKSLLKQIKKDLAVFLKKTLDLTENNVAHLLEQPRHPEHGHLAWPLFSFSKTQKTAPKELAQSFSEKINKQLPPFLESCQALGGFINFKFQTNYLKEKLETLISQTQLAHFSSEKKEHWLMDFASPNVAKYMNIGHLRATVLGQALVNLAKAFGVKVTALNHLGDWGSQFGKLLWAYKKWGKEYDFEKEAFSSLVQLYVRFYQEAESDEKNVQEARELFHRLEQGDAELHKLWTYFVDLSLKDYEKYWKIFNVKHDLIKGESFYISFLQDLKSRLKAKKLLEKSEGAEVVFLEDDKPPCLISKSDGASTYSARDLCSLIYRFETLKVDRNIYITGSDQNLHFQQIFKVAEKVNPQWKDKSLHLSFGMYRFKDKGKMSSRQGQAVYLKDILEQAVERVKKIIQERNPELENKEEVSRQVGVGALVFYDLMNDRTKDVDFEWSKVLDFTALSGPFVQYSLVRSQSLLNKAESKTSGSFASSFEGEEELNLVWRLICFESACFQAFSHYKPHILARYLLDLAKEFNRFYAEKKILRHPREKDLLLLTQITNRVLKRGLEILNVPRPTAM